MTTRRRFSREIHKMKLARREDLESRLYDLVKETLQDHDPTALPASVRVAARLSAIIGSQITIQTQITQRMLLSLEDDISEYGTEFVYHLVKAARKTKERRLGKFFATPPVISDTSEQIMRLADDWAGPVAGPTAIERYYGIPRSTLYRWQKLNEVVALNTRTSKHVFPLKQFLDGRPAPGIADLIGIFADARKAWLWLLEPHDEFDGQPPLNTLISGEVELVLSVASQIIIK